MLPAVVEHTKILTFSTRAYFYLFTFGIESKITMTGEIIAPHQPPIAVSLYRNIFQVISPKIWPNIESEMLGIFLIRLFLDWYLLRIEFRSR